MSKTALVFFSLGAVVMGLTLSSCGDDGRGGATCTPACASGLTCCGTGGGMAFCQATQSNTQHCGGCNMPCPMGQTCSGGVCSGTTVDGGGIPDSTVMGDCSPSCSSAQRCCGTTCLSRSVAPGADGRADPSFTNCNGCGIACDADRASACSTTGSGAPQCACGSFAACIVGETCVNDAGNFRCVNTQTDRNNCGTVGNVCPGEEICVSGVCSCGSTGAACPSGSSCCGGACIDTQTDTNNCGACGNVCGMSGPNCVAGSCFCGSSPACAAPSMTSIGASCCDDACVPNSATSCGCGVVCDGSDDCIYSSGGLIPGLPGGMGVCCGTSLGPLGSFCSDFGGFDGGFPGLDGGLPFP